MSTRRAITIATAILVIFISLVFMKVTLSARQEFRQAEQALQAHDLDDAITHFNRALHWYSPGSKPVQSSVERLWEIGEKAEAKKDFSLALHAYRMLRSGLYAARSFYTPYPDWIAQCDERIATLVSQQPPALSPNGTPYPIPDKVEILKTLKTKTEPDLFWTIVLEMGFIGWVGCTVAFICRVCTGPNEFMPRRAFFWGMLIVCFYALWLVGMLRA